MHFRVFLTILLRLLIELNDFGHFDGAFWDKVHRVWSTNVKWTVKNQESGRCRVKLDGLVGSWPFQARNWTESCRPWKFCQKLIFQRPGSGRSWVKVDNLLKDNVRSQLCDPTAK